MLDRLLNQLAKEQTDLAFKGELSHNNKGVSSLWIISKKCLKR